MSVVNDVRIALEDFLPPELRELKARFEALEQRMKMFEEGTEHPFERLESNIDVLSNRFETLSNRVESLNAKVDNRFDRLEYLLSLNDRVSRLEGQRRPTGLSIAFQSHFRTLVTLVSKPAIGVSMKPGPKSPSPKWLAYPNARGPQTAFGKTMANP
jgi:hypothetical protein